MRVDKKSLDKDIAIFGMTIDSLIKLWNLDATEEQWMPLFNRADALQNYIKGFAVLLTTEQMNTMYQLVTQSQQAYKEYQARRNKN